MVCVEFGPFARDLNRKSDLDLERHVIGVFSRFFPIAFVINALCLCAKFWPFARSVKSCHIFFF